MPSRSFASFAIGAGNLAADAADVARWGYQLYGGQVIDSTLVEQMDADLQDSDVGLYGLGTTVMSDDIVLMFGHGWGWLEWPYTRSMLFVWTGDQPVAVAVLSPEPADFGSGIYDIFMGCTASPPAAAEPVACPRTEGGRRC